MMRGGKKSVIFQLEVTANPLKSQSQTNSTCLCRTENGNGWQRLAGCKRPEEWEDEEEPGCWNGISG